MEVSDDRVDLFVFGRDFYLGSASKTIENGWCEFEALGLEQAKAAFGSSRRLGTVWYLAERVPSDALRSFYPFIDCYTIQHKEHKELPNEADYFYYSKRSKESFMRPN